MPYCYIIHSDYLNRFYSGICQDDLIERINNHNNHDYGSHRFTAKATDWKLFLTIECDSMSHARRIELHIKRMKSSIYIENLKRYPELVQELKSRFKTDT